MNLINAEIIKETEKKDLLFYKAFIDRQPDYVGEDYLLPNACTVALIRNENDVEMLLEFDGNFFHKVVSKDSVPERDILDSTFVSYFMDVASKLKKYVVGSNPEDYCQ